MEFYIFRHAYSCTNIIKLTSKFKYYKEYLNKTKKEPHITNWGIISATRASKKKLMKSIKAEEFYVSPLLRTWETAACMFPDIKIFKIGKYLREGNKWTGPQEKDLLLGYSDTPGTKKVQLDRFNDFKKHVSTLTDFLSKKEIKKIQNTRIIRRKYTKKDTLKGDIELFIQKTKFKKKKILVVCHGVIMQHFMKKHLSKDTFKKFRKIKKKGDNNLFGLKVLCDKNKKILSVKIIFNGYSNKKIPKKISEFNDLC